VVATPIGNLADLTERAAATLRSVGRIFCEDTRVTAKLTHHLGASIPLEPFHQHSGSKALARVLEFLEAGQSLALVTDAGTPGIADPGGQLVAAVRERFGEQAKIVPIPGVSAVTAILSVCGFPADRFVFLGFPPTKKGRQTFFRELGKEERTIVLYESPYRIEDTLTELERVVVDRPIVLGRELTKLFEDVVLGDATTLRQWIKSGPNRTRGEFTLAIGPQ
jgi:16S rRNA (cytidine1402-2'-O)-methyltransferase